MSGGKPRHYQMTRIYVLVIECYVYFTSCTFASKFDESVLFIWDHIEDERQVKR